MTETDPINAESADIASFDDLKDVLAARGIDVDDPEIAASLQKFKEEVDTGGIVLTRTTLQEIAATIDQLQTSQGELSLEELEAIAGGKISPITRWLAGSVGFVVGAVEEGVTDFVEASKNLFD